MVWCAGKSCAKTTEIQAFHESHYYLALFLKNKNEKNYLVTFYFIDDTLQYHIAKYAFSI
jgi:hypothetical protein